jgi:cell wall-associated NlpC family hydrolase
MKELLLIGTTIIALTSGSLTAVSTATYPERPERGNHVSVALIHKAELKAEARLELLEKVKLEKVTNKINKAIDSLESHVGRTWYVFSGSTPAGWDCSGLTLWFYEQLGVELEHRASQQENYGTKTKNPKPGDLVVFKYNGNRSAYHVGIYIGSGRMIHAPKHGHLTRVEDIEKFAGKYSEVSYTTIVKTI